MDLLQLLCLWTGGLKLDSQDWRNLPTSQGLEILEMLQKVESDKVDNLFMCEQKHCT